MTTTFLAIGDVHGYWSSVRTAISQSEGVLGRLPDFVLQVGDAEAHRNEDDLAGCHTSEKHRKVGEFRYLRPGDISAPMYFIGGNHDPYVSLDQLSGPFPVPWGIDGLGVSYLGRSGATKIHDSVTVAWLSGIYSSGADPSARQKSVKARGYFSLAEVAHTISEASDLGKIDVLVTHNWPGGLHPSLGDQPIRDLVETIRPQLHLCGHGHDAFVGNIGITTVHALAVVPPASIWWNHERFGWWRLYEKTDSGVIRCIGVGE